MHKLFLEDIPADLEMVGDIAIDTETLGLKIKRDRLCLIQIADSAGNIFLIKYNSKIYNSPNFVKILTDKTRTKIFHYGRFDVAVLMNAFQIKEITPIFCTKIASKLTRTYTEFHGLKTICRELLGVELDKESQTSNWAAETLTEKQIKYAINDVLHLHNLRDNLVQALKKINREEMAEGCFKFLHHVCTMELQDFDPNYVINH